MIRIEKQDEILFSIADNGKKRILYKPEWRDLTLFFTNDCNSKCIICPQTADERNGNYLELNKRLIDLRPKDLEQIGITGGEPTLYKNELIELLNYIHVAYPKTPVSLLTNGRNFTDRNFVKSLSDIHKRKLMICIPLYAANYEQHDEIVGVRNAFRQTLEGIFNLYRFELPIEIRIVIFKYNYMWLTEFANFIWRNLPFVHHIAFMGMEYVGSAGLHKAQFWIDPYHFKDELAAAIDYLHRRRMYVSVYNIPFCLLNESTQKFARDSISAWKKKYFSACDCCRQKEKCSGWFATSSIESAFIRPIP